MTSSDLHRLYDEFQQHFPLEKLPEMTLTEYTNLNRSDSFCFWLESRTQQLGSIWVGSAYKFGIYRYSKLPESKGNMHRHDDEYAWYAKYDAGTSEEAFATVKDAIVRIARAARDGDYEQIDKIHELGNSYKWKIAFMYSDLQLLPIFKKVYLRKIANLKGGDFSGSANSAEMQRFLIGLKGEQDVFDYYRSLWELLEEPEQADEATKQEEKEDSVSRIRYWLYSPGPNAAEWQRCIDTSTICLKWDELGDYRDYDSIEAVRERFRELNGSDTSFSNNALAVWNFRSELRPGDIVFVKKGTKKIIGRGVIEGDYEYNEDATTYSHIRKVRWTNLGEWKLSNNILPVKTLTDITPFPELTANITSAIAASGASSADEGGGEQYWWLVANPKYWSFNEMAIGESVAYNVKNEKGNKRRIAAYFDQAREGDIVICYEATPIKKIVALARVAAPSDGEKILFEKTETLTETISWNDFKDIPGLEDLEFVRNPYGSFFKLSPQEYETFLLLIRQENMEPESNPLLLRSSLSSYTKADFLSEVFLSTEQYDAMMSALRRKQNIILTGAPGVGKTFSARRLAYAMMGEVDPSRIEMVQFHQSYSYEDFIMGYKPTEGGGFELRTGIFYDFCKRAAADADKDYFFIIDEINRGNISKIFGELLMLIEKSYRGTSIRLAYSREAFAVPRNLHIIGMMNTADRSLAMLDIALQRRFHFIRLEPGFDTPGFRALLARHADERVEKVVEAVKRLNMKIAADDALGEGFCFGHSYFCEDTDSEGWIEGVVRFDLCPLIDEYWFDDKQKREEAKKTLIDLL